MGTLYLLNVRNLDKIPQYVNNKFFTVRSCKNEKYFIKCGWKIVHELSPNKSLFGEYLNLKKIKNWNANTFETVYKPSFEKQMKNDNNMRKILNHVYHLLKYENEDVAFMCYCTEFTLCHLSILANAYQNLGITTKVFY